MFFERAERELTKEEPWSTSPVDRMRWSEQPQDCWQMENMQKSASTSKSLGTHLRFWRDKLFWRWLFSHKQVIQQHPFTKQ